MVSDGQGEMEVPGRVVWEGRVVVGPLGLSLISEMLYRVVISKPGCVQDTKKTR